MNKISDRDRYGGSDVIRADPKRRSKNIRKAAVNAADKWASLDVRLDAKCVLAEFINGHVCKGMIMCGHLFSRVAYSTRWHEENLYPICAWTNIVMENDPIVARQLLEYAEVIWGKEEIAELYRLYRSAVPIKTYKIQQYAQEWHDSYIEHCERKE
jgi:hypothetical protein